VFSRARAAAPCVLLLDQIETVAKVRGEDESSENTFDRLLSTLLVEMAGISSSENGDSGDVIVLATTHNINLLDPAILRPGRLDQHVFIPLPSREARCDIIHHYMSSMPLCPATIPDARAFAGVVASVTDGFSGAQLENVCREAAMCSLRESVEAGYLEARHFEAALYILHDLSPLLSTVSS
jgi:transitional endoplasmic reticulum ATPase